MQFLRTLFWVVLAVLAVIFAFNNWEVVTIRLWSDIVVDSPLPILLLITFLIGFLPGLVLHRATRWTLRRRLDAANRTISETRAIEPSVSAPSVSAAASPPGALL